jgi:hypothetical protein
MTPIVPGKSYSHRDEWLRAPVGVAALCIPAGYNGRLGHESVFKILSNDRSVSCFLHFHDAASPAPRGWISVPFALENQQMQPVGSASTINGAHVRRFEGGAYVACKLEKRDAIGNGISCSIAADLAHAAKLDTFIAELLGKVKLGAQTQALKPAAQPAKPPRPAAPPAAPVVAPPPPPPPRPSIDRALVGVWHWSEFMSSGGFSLTSHRYRVLGSDGQFAQGGQSFATSVLRDPSGNWAGMNSLRSGAGPEDRGRWETQGRQLTLHFEDGMYSEFDYFVQGGSLMLTSSNGRRTLWTRT